VLASLAVAAVAVAGVIGATISKPDQAPAASDAVDASLEMLDGGTASLADYAERS
jgi:hypothetical protein